MAEYSDTTSSGGYTTNATLNPETDSVTIVVTAPNGTTATVTAARGDLDAAKTSLFSQILPPGTENAKNIYRAVSRDFGIVVNSVFKQQDKAEAAARATNKPVPDAPAPPPSTNNQADPAIAPAPNNVPPVENASVPATEITPDRGAYIPINAQKQGEDQLSTTAANTPVQPQKVVDEFDGIDAQVAANEAAANESAAERNRLQNTNSALGAALADAQTQATRQDKANFNAKKDWRVRLSLAGGADYLYKAEDPGILGPLVQTNGVIFPYTPAISVAYAAQYDPTTLTHTNYKFYSYNSSSVDQITLSCDFTAQDVFEANYLLAVIHFFRSVTKMFYGQDNNPKNGTPPPLCYLYGLGAFQFDSHPLAVTNFTYSLPTDVDYIRAGEVSAPKNPPATYSKGQVSKTRLQGLQPGAGVAPPQFSGAYRVLEPTYVPTKIQISITAVPIMTRNMVSNEFSLKQYATGQLIRGTQAGSNGGFW